MMKKAIIAALVLVILGGFGTYLRSHQAAPDREPDFSAIPYEEGIYYGNEHRFDEFAYDVLKADTTTLRMYRTLEGDIIWLFMAYFPSQKYGSQIHSPKHCLPGGGYKILTIEPYDLKINDNTSLTVNRLLIGNSRRQELMLYWFETRSGVISNEYDLKLDLMKNSMFLLPTDAAILRITMPLPLDSDIDEATGKALNFLRLFYPSMEKALPFSSNM